MSAQGVKHLAGFFAIGALLYGAKALLPAAAPIVVNAAEVDQLRADWIRETRRAPSDAELAAAVRSYADDEMLVREALRLGLQRSDPVVRTRLVQNLRFARGDEKGDEAALFEDALKLGMAHRDLVARRRLVLAMEQRFAASATIDDAQLDAYIAAHPQRYRSAPRISFDQQFTPNDPGGAPLLPTGSLAHQSQADLARVFGADFARAAMQVAPGHEWSAPMASAFGTHRLRVTAVQPGGALLPNARREAYYALLEEREREAVREALAKLRREYPLEVASR